MSLFADVKERKENYPIREEMKMAEENTNETVDQQTENQNVGEEKTDTTTEKVEEKTFTQEDVNNLVVKESRKQQEKLLKQLGVDDFKDAKEGMQKLKEYQDAQKTDAEKQQEQLESLSTEKESLTSENTSLKAQVSALKNGVKGDSVEDVVALAERRVNDDVTMDDAIKQVVEDYPHFAEEQQKEEEAKPSFTTGQHQKQSGASDPFLAKLAKYK